MKPMDSSWIVVDEREGVGRVDTWSEYLCVSHTNDPEQFEIAICRYEIVGEIPADWFDDEGQPLPEYSDGTGCLVVPEYYDGWAGRAKLTGHDGEYLLGGLSWDESFGPPIAVNQKDAVEISSAVNDLGWVASDDASLVGAITRAMKL